MMQSTFLSDSALGQTIFDDAAWITLTLARTQKATPARHTQAKIRIIRFIISLTPFDDESVPSICGQIAS